MNGTEEHSLGSMESMQRILGSPPCSVFPHAVYFWFLVAILGSRERIRGSKELILGSVTSSMERIAGSMEHMFRSTEL